MMNISRKTAVVGAYEHPTRFAPDKTVYQIMAESMRGALDDAGLTIKDVDGDLHRRHRHERDGNHRAVRLSQPDAQLCRWNQSIGGCSFLAHTAHAAAAIAAGLCEVAVVVYGSQISSARFAIGTGGGGGGGEPCEQYDAPFGVTTVGAYAMVAQRHMHEYGTTPEQLAEVAVTMRLHASMNPAAKYRDLITVEDVLASRVISSPLHLLDCCIISDGGGALVITSAERARDLKKKPVYILGAAETVAPRRRGSSRLSRERGGANRHASPSSARA